MNERTSLPDLTGCRLSVTHSGGGADQLIQTFSTLGATVHHIPLIEFEWLKEAPRLQDLQDVQWLVLTSPQGVKALSSALNGHDVPAGIQWAAVGESTARALREAGWPVHFTPSQATGTSLGQELPLSAGGKVLHVTSNLSKDDLSAALHARGASYERLVLYRTLPHTPSHAETAQLLASHLVTLASSSAAQHFATLGGQQVPVVVMGQQTAGTARELGFQTVLVARRPTLEALEDVVFQFLTRPRM
ncbi:uroporphyrinogen-III synthase [Deinococcus fonticola]|uniref:uroporphyrinogen-III synthase n=1 Tax=Deinococcus fonticola TaxID=2528713 RepID=UPI001074C8AA|nr:uroporphyrinogen-III synthase [Deinococcus fonticola]